MRKISGQLIWSKPMSLSRAAKSMSNFVAADNGSSAAVSVYLHYTLDALNQLIHFHGKTSTISELENCSLDRTGKSQMESSERNPNGEVLRDSKNIAIRKKTAAAAADGVTETNPNEDAAVEVLKIGEDEEKKEANLNEDEVQNLENGEENKKKKKKKKTNDDAVDSKEKGSSNPDANIIENAVEKLESDGKEEKEQRSEEKKKMEKKKKKKMSDAVESEEKRNSNPEANPNEDEVQKLESREKGQKNEEKKKKKKRKSNDAVDSEEKLNTTPVANLNEDKVQKLESREKGQGNEERKKKRKGNDAVDSEEKKKSSKRRRVEDFES